MLESTTASPGNPGYGYLWWLWIDGAYAAIGIFGQLIWVDPRNDLVIVIHSAAPHATSSEHYAHRAALVAALQAHALAQD